MENLNNIYFWKKQYGVLPLHINNIKEDRYLMLNGGNGDFCLQTFEDGSESLFKEYAWSSNTKNYLIIGDDKVKVVNWLDDKVDTLSRNTVYKNIETFHRYLLTKSYSTPNDVIPFVLHVFRSLRNETNEKQSPVEALSLLFQLLINLGENATSNMFYDFEKVKTPSSFEYYLNVLKDGVKSIKPNLDIILRHVSGALFEEAHKEVVFFDHQLDLFGGMSSKHKSKINQYSSVHYTPAYIARTIVENSLRELELSQKESIKIMDPSCGSSEFIIEALKQLKNIGYNGEIEVWGYDVSDTAIHTSKFLLHYENETQWQGRLKLNFRKIDNSLEIEWGNDIDLLLMNPPFVSWELMDKSERDILRDVLDNVFNSAKPNLASGFLYKAIHSLSDGGVIGCIMPTSIFSFESYKKLRSNIKDIIDLKLLAKLGNFAFANALTDVSILIGQKPQGNNVPQIIWTNNEKGIISDALRELRKIQSNKEIASINSNFNIYTPKRFPIMTDSWQVVSQAEEEFINELEVYVAEKKLTRVMDVFTVKQGIRQGNKSFVIDACLFEQMPNDERCIYRKILDNKSIKNGFISSFRYVFYPYDEHGLLFKTEDEFKKKAPISYDYFKQYREILSKRARKSDNDWWTLSEHRAWLRVKSKRLYSTEFGSSDSFAFDTDGEFVVERGNAWIPKKVFEDDDFYFYLAVFSSSTFDRLLSIYAKPILSGFNLGAASTKDIPIPDIKRAKINNNLYLKLSSLGRELSSGKSDAIYSINDAVKLYYPLSDATYRDYK